MNIRTPFLLVLLSVSAGFTACRFGPDPSRSPTATSPYGAQVEIDLTKTVSAPGWAIGPTTRLELVAITDSGLMVDDGAVFFLVQFGSISKASLKDTPGVGAIKGYGPDPERLDRMRRYSRYPFGLTEAQLASLLAVRNQDALVIIG
jgi:hypothetical protein